MIEVTSFSRETHEALVKGWWLEREHVDFPSAFMSDFGFVGLHNGEPISALFLYPTLGSKIACVGWPISKPGSDRGARSESLNRLFKAVSLKASSLGYELLWTVSGLKRVQERLLKNGYSLGDSNVNQYWGKAGS